MCLRVWSSQSVRNVHLRTEVLTEVLCLTVQLHPCMLCAERHPEGLEDHGTVAQKYLGIVLCFCTGLQTPPRRLNLLPLPAKSSRRSVIVHNLKLRIYAEDDCSIFTLRKGRKSFLSVLGALNISLRSALSFHKLPFSQTHRRHILIGPPRYQIPSPPDKLPSLGRHDSENKTFFHF